MKRLYLLIFGILILAAPPVKAQGLTHPRDIPAAFHESPKLMVELDSRRSFISNRDNQILGGRIGFNFDQNIAVGFGLYALASRFDKSFTLTNEIGGIDTIRSRLKFAYISMWAEYILLVTKSCTQTQPGKDFVLAF